MSYRPDLPEIERRDSPGRPDGDQRLLTTDECHALAASIIITGQVRQTRIDRATLGTRYRGLKAEAAAGSIEAAEAEYDYAIRSLMAGLCR